MGDQQDDIPRRASRLNAVTDILDAYESDLRAESRRADDLAREVKALRLEVDQRKTDGDTTRSVAPQDAGRWEAEATSLREELNERDRVLARIRALQDEDEKLYKTLKQEKMELQTQLSAAERSVESLEADLQAEREKDQDDLRRENNELREERDAMRVNVSKLPEMTQRYERLEGQLQQFADVLEAKGHLQRDLDAERVENERLRDEIELLTVKARAGETTLERLPLIMDRVDEMENALQRKDRLIAELQDHQAPRSSGEAPAAAVREGQTAVSASEAAEHAGRILELEKRIDGLQDELAASKKVEEETKRRLEESLVEKKEMASPTQGKRVTIEDPPVDREVENSLRKRLAEAEEALQAQAQVVAEKDAEIARLTALLEEARQQIPVAQEGSRLERKRPSAIDIEPAVAAVAASAESASEEATRESDPEDADGAPKDMMLVCDDTMCCLLPKPKFTLPQRDPALRGLAHMDSPEQPVVVDPSTVDSRSRASSKAATHRTEKYRVVFLGEHASGRTSLRKCMEPPGHASLGRLLPTSLPAVTPTVLPEFLSVRVMVEDKPLDVHFYDFPDTGAPHAVFASRYSLYVWVWNMLEEDNSLRGECNDIERRWLLEVQARHKGGYLLICGTRKDQLRRSDTATLNTQCNNILQRFQRFLDTIHTGEGGLRILGSYAVSCKQRTVFGSGLGPGKMNIHPEFTNMVWNILLKDSKCDPLLASTNRDQRYMQAAMAVKRLHQDEKVSSLTANKYMALLQGFEIMDQRDIQTCTELLQCWHVAFPLPVNASDDVALLLSPIVIHTAIVMLQAAAGTIRANWAKGVPTGGGVRLTATPLDGLPEMSRELLAHHGMLAEEAASPLFVRLLKELPESTIDLLLRALDSIDVLYSAPLPAPATKRDNIHWECKKVRYIPFLFTRRVPPHITQLITGLLRRGFRMSYQLHPMPREAFASLQCRLSEWAIPLCRKASAETPSPKSPKSPPAGSGGTRKRDGTAGGGETPWGRVRVAALGRPPGVEVANFRDGIWIGDDHHRVWVTYDPGKSRVDLQTTPALNGPEEDGASGSCGESAQHLAALMQKIDRKIVRVLARYPAMHIRVSVPCPKTDCDGQVEVHHHTDESIRPREEETGAAGGTGAAAEGPADDPRFVCPSCTTVYEGPTVAAELLTPPLECPAPSRREVGAVVARNVEITVGAEKGRQLMSALYIGPRSTTQPTTRNVLHWLDRVVATSL